jgi:hypothetical protein
MSAFGVGETVRDASPMQRLMYFLLLSDIYADKLTGERALVASGLDWTIVYPVLLSDGPPTGAYRVGERLSMRGVPKVARADVADFLVGELAAHRFARARAVISG